jgi:AcrR family transcriptional regulator
MSIGQLPEQRMREPTQERSRARVKRLLNAAERLLANEGYDAITIVRLTKAARVPVGTFYQFFDDKDAIVEVLARRYVSETADLIEQRIDEIVELPPGSRLAEAYAAFVELYRSNPAYRAIRAGSYTSPDLRRADDANVAAAIEGVKRILTTGTGLRDSAAVRSASRTLQLVADALLYRTGEVHLQDTGAFVSEARSMLNVLEEDAIKRLAKRKPTRRRRTAS